MAVEFPTSASLEVRYLPDEWDGRGPDPHDVANPVTGFVQVGATIGGAFRPLAQFKASGLYADMQRAQAQQQAAEQQAAQQQAAQQAASAPGQSPQAPQPASGQPGQPQT